MIYAVHFSMWVYITIYKSLCDLWKTDFYFLPPKCCMSATLHRMLCCLYKINLFFFTLTISLMSGVTFLLYPLQKNKKSNRRNSTPPTKSAIKKCCYKMTWSNSPIKHQIIKSFTNTIPNTSRQLNSQGFWVGRWTFTSILVRECA